uniref:EGF-like domain-containing protein n=1 Tax=Anopheles dirus TaxID=7168 RepID=A0A182NYC4_9DIPT
MRKAVVLEEEGSVGRVIERQKQMKPASYADWSTFNRSEKTSCDSNGGLVRKFDDCSMHINDLLNSGESYRIMTKFSRNTTYATYFMTHAIGVYKFLSRISGRRRINLQKLQELYSRSVYCVAIFLILSSSFQISDACSSRTTPKPRPPSSTPRPNITFHTYKCPPAYAAWYCLNDATCFTVKIGDSLLYNCECADGYMGPRCEYKDLDGSYLPTRPRVMLETASIASGAIGSLVLIMIGWCCWCIRRHQQRKCVGKENGVDTVDSPSVLHVVHSERLLRPFGTHHLKTIPMSDSFK